MFDDFAPHPRRKERKRLAGAVASALALYGGLSAALIVTSAKARQIAEETLLQVEFRVPRPKVEPAPPPEPTPAVAAPEPAPPKPRPAAKRRKIEPPQAVPEEKPPESDGELAPAEAPAPVEGFLDGVAGGQGTARAPAPVKAPPAPVVKPAPPAPRPVKLEKLVVPRALMTDPPRYPAKLRRQGIEGVVVVSFEVLEDGRVASPRIVSGPAEFHELVLKGVLSWRFQPARRGALAVRHRIQHTIRFRLEDG